MARKAKTGDPAQPLTMSEQYGGVELLIEAGFDNQCYPAKDGLPESQYTHFDVSLWAENTIDGPITPTEAGVPRFEPYFTPGKLGGPSAPCLAREVLDDLRRSLREVHRAAA